MHSNTKYSTYEVRMRVRESALYVRDPLEKCEASLAQKWREEMKASMYSYCTQGKTSQERKKTRQKKRTKIASKSWALTRWPPVRGLQGRRVEKVPEGLQRTSTLCLFISSTWDYISITLDHWIGGEERGRSFGKPKLGFSAQRSRRRRSRAAACQPVG